MSPRLEEDGHRRGELHAELCRLVEKHGVDDIAWMLDVVREDIREGHFVASAPPEPRKSEKHAVSYEGRLIIDTGRALLWFIPRDNDPLANFGQAAWIPKQLILSAILEAGSPFGLLRTTKPVPWRPASRIGGSVTFLDVRRLA